MFFKIAIKLVEKVEKAVNKAHFLKHRELFKIAPIKFSWPFYEAFV